MEFNDKNGNSQYNNKDGNLDRSPRSGSYHSNHESNSFYSYKSNDSRYSSRSYRSDYLTSNEIEHRAQKRQRMECTPSVWGPSPPASPEYEKQSDAISSTPKGEEEPERETKDSVVSFKEKKRGSSHRHHHHRRHHHRHHHSSSSVSSEKDPGASDSVPMNEVSPKMDQQSIKESNANTQEMNSMNEDLSDSEEGPQPESMYGKMSNKPLKFGENISRAEGNAMAEFVKQNKRIPRRGEVGLTSEQIENFENQGYVMSGSRHKLMNAVRLKKENEVYTAEEKRLLAQHNIEEFQRREKEFRGKINQRLREMQSGSSIAPNYGQKRNT